MILFLLVLSALIIAHEWGHYAAAKRMGIRVERFSVGFGPVLWKFRPKETEFCLSMIPLGGYVKLAGESPEESKGEPWEFHSRPNRHKFFVIAAGPFLNLILAFFVFSAVYWVGQPALTSLVGKVMPGYPAEAAGLRAGDRIIRVNEQPVFLWEDLLMAIHEAETPGIKVQVARKNRIEELEILPRSVSDKDMLGRKQRVRRIGVMPDGEIVRIPSGFLESLALAGRKVLSLVGLIFTSIWLILTGALSFKESMAGPIGIYFMTQQAAEVGLPYLLDFSARLSVSLFVINILPIPVLDGGHLLFILIEGVIRRPVPDRVKDYSSRVGLALLLMLMAYAIYSDALRFQVFEKILGLVGLR